jgi:outer membrane biosynthesis protein TonB
MNNEEKPKTNLPITKPIYEIGYRRPPKSNWFPPGASGNPAGRPKGSKNKPPVLTDQYISTILRDEVYKQVPVDAPEGGGTVTTSAARLVVRNLVKSAISGNFRAAQFVISASRSIESAAAAELEEDYVYAEAYKNHWEREISRAKDYHRAIPQPVPHPDHILLDDRHRQVIFTGPRNEEEKAEYDALMAEMAERSGGEEPASEEPAGEEPPKERPPKEEPPREDPPTEEPPREEPPKEEPKTEKPSGEAECSHKTASAEKDTAAVPMPGTVAASAARAVQPLGSRPYFE